MGLLVALVLGTIMGLVLRPLQRKILQERQAADYYLFLLAVVILSLINLTLLSMLLAKGGLNRASIFNSGWVVMAWILPFSLSSFLVYVRAVRENHQLP
jgi:hypothetical protein